MKIHNYSAGPCVLPKSVMAKAAESVVNYNNTGLSIIEMSHRSKEFVDVMDRSVSLVRELLDIPTDYEVLFLQGGASMQFLMTAYNFLRNEAAFLNTGTWSKKAIKEAKIFGKVDILGSSEDENFNHIPKISIDKEYDYFHCTSNNTIFGTQIHNFPKSNVPVFCDMSSDIFSRVINFQDFEF